jgi:hypothetical protein
MFKSPFDEHLAKYVEEHADEPIMKRAWLLAEGKGTAQDKRDHLQDLKAMVRGIATPLPYDPATRLAPARGTRHRE